MIPNSIPYEVLRRSDHTVALSVNAGLITFEPRHIQLGIRDCFITSGCLKIAIRLTGIPDDVKAAIETTGKIPLFEFGSSGLMFSHELTIRNSN